jgi:hypothetical protein
MHITTFPNNKTSTYENKKKEIFFSIKIKILQRFPVKPVANINE